MTPAHYHIDIFWSDEDDCWVANVPDLGSCSAFGDTPAEAAAEAQIAMELWLETARDVGLTIPEPSYRSAVSEHKKAA
jgi:predicted RNase H-like HicB family nuclease